MNDFLNYLKTIWTGKKAPQTVIEHIEHVELVKKDLDQAIEDFLQSVSNDQINHRAKIHQYQAEIKVLEARITHHERLIDQHATQAEELQAIRARLHHG